MTANNGVMAWKERLIQVLYIMVGLVIAFPILYGNVSHHHDPGGCSFSSKLPHGIWYGTDQYIPWYDDRIFRLSHEHFPVQTKL